MFYTWLSHSSAAATHLLPCLWDWKLSSTELLFPAQCNLAQVYSLHNHWLGEVGRGLCSSSSPQLKQTPKEKPSNCFVPCQASKCHLFKSSWHRWRWQIQNTWSCSTQHPWPELSLFILIPPVWATAWKPVLNYKNKVILSTECFYVCSVIYGCNGQMVTTKVKCSSACTGCVICCECNSKSKLPHPE